MSLSSALPALVSSAGAKCSLLTSKVSISASSVPQKTTLVSYFLCYSASQRRVAKAVVGLSDSCFFLRNDEAFQGAGGGDISIALTARKKLEEISKGPAPTNSY